ncbi:hypothetical protein BI364_03630 [Acidihalobacter yilgarnensis]|uniref:Cation transporter n=1 Tax=Acidihalobacter yilgarnensis TaxID=2819280 RepID=A0A1D8IL98_9GAMM|nr:hypothetical protein BI364_03630 [Acidihalobacter yilgarnensis]
MSHSQHPHAHSEAGPVSHAEGHHGHGHHHHAGGTDRRRLLGALLLTAGFMLIEAAGGWWSGSLALLADAGHMLTDTFALGLAWLAVGMARRPADHDRTYGYHRLEVLAAFVNGLVLLAVVGGIYYEAALRLFHPEPVAAGEMLLIAALGLFANIASFALLHGGHHDHGNLNRRAALLHVIGDLLGSVAAIAAALVIMMTGWMPIDPLLSMLIGLLILRSTWAVIRESGQVLLEAAPADLDVAALCDVLQREVPGVLDVHHVHVWSLTPERPLLTMHLRAAPGSDSAQVLAAVKSLLAHRYGITHSAVQVEQGPCPDGDATEQVGHAPGCC